MVCSQRYAAASILAVLAAALVLILAPAASGQDAPTQEAVDPDLFEGDEDDGEDETQATVDGEGITVIGKQVEPERVLGSAHALGEEQLEALEYDDVQRILNALPGVYVRGEDGFGLRPNIGLRGANSDRSAKVTLMEDGILLAPAPYSAPAAYYFPLSTRLIGLEVYKGPASIQYGPQTVGGAINLRTRRIPTGHSGLVDISGGSERSGKVHGAYGWGDETWGVLVEGVHLRSDGFKKIDGGGDTGFYRNEFMAKGHWQTDSTSDVFHQVSFKLGYSDERSHETYVGLTRSDFRDDPLRRYAGTQDAVMRWWRTLAHLRYLVVPSNEVEFEFVAYRHDMNRVWRKLNRFRGASLRDVIRNPNDGQNPEFMAVLRGEADSDSPDEDLLLGTNDRTYVSQGAQLEGSWRPSIPVSWITSELEFGIRYHYDEIDRFHFENPHRMISATLVPTPEGRQITANSLGSTHAFAAYAHETLELGDFVLSPGIRLEVITRDFSNDLEGSSQGSETDVVVLPGAGVAYKPGDWTILAGVHRGFSPVSPGQAASVEPEESINYEAGVRYANDWLHAEAIGYFSDYSNLTAECTPTSCPDEQLNQQFNGGRVWVYGAELSFGMRRALGAGFGLGVNAAYTLTQSQFRNSFQSESSEWGEVEAGDSLPYVPEHQANLLLGLTWRSLQLTVAGTYIAAMRDLPGQGTDLGEHRTDDQFLLDLALRWDTTEWITLYTRVENALDQRALSSSRPVGTRPIRPLLFQLGCTLHL